jgi:hypothetical protein
LRKSRWQSRAGRWVRGQLGKGVFEGRIVRRPKGGERGPAAPPLVYGLKGGSAGERVVPANQSRAVGLG